MTPEERAPKIESYGNAYVTLADGLLFIHDLERFLSLDEERRLAEALDEAEA